MSSSASKVKPFGGATTKRWYQSSSTPRQPLVDVVEIGNRYEVFAELPGVRKEDIELSYDRVKHVLSLRATKEHPLAHEQEAEADNAEAEGKPNPAKVTEGVSVDALDVSREHLGTEVESEDQVAETRVSKGALGKLSTDLKASQDVPASPALSTASAKSLQRNSTKKKCKKEKANMPKNLLSSRFYGTYAVNIPITTGDVDVSRDFQANFECGVLRLNLFKVPIPTETTKIISIS